MATSKTPPLEYQIEAVRADIDRFIDDRVKALREQYPGLPEPWLRADFIKGRCQCAIYLDQKDKA